MSNTSSNTYVDIDGFNLNLPKYEYDGDECAIEMEFYDGIALATHGCGLSMTYPTLAEVAKSPARQSKIQDYIGIYDGTINQHDVALRYGVLKFDENKTKVSTSMKMQSIPLRRRLVPRRFMI